MAWREQEPINQFNITIEALIFSGAVSFGSRALGVTTEHSDSDYAILRANFERLTSLEEVLEWDITQYFKVIPPYGENTIIPNANVNGDEVDILIIEHQEHIDIIKASVVLLKTMPKSFLAIKPNRVELYEHILLSKGFILKPEKLKA